MVTHQMCYIILSHRPKSNGVKCGDVNLQKCRLNLSKILTNLKFKCQHGPLTQPVLYQHQRDDPLVNFRERQFEEDACFFKGIRYHQTQLVSYQQSCHLHDFTSENLSLSSLKESQTKRLQRQLKMFQVKVEIRSRGCYVSTTYIVMKGQYRPPRVQRTYQH